MGKVKQTVGKVSKPLGKDSKITKKKLNTKKVIKANNLVPVLKNIGIDALLHDSKPTLDFKLDESHEKPVKCLMANPKGNLFDEDQIKSGVSALFQLVEKTSAREPTLFEDGETIFLQITAIKVPKTPSRQIHMNLPHSLLKSDAEICLIVQDREDPKDHDNTIEYYEKLLKKHGITNVKCILPYHQFKTEYGNQFELKRKLSSLYDFFLVEGAVHGYVVDRLGKIFYEKRKMPTIINMKASNLKTHFENLLHKTILQIHCKSDSFSIEVGNTKMMSDEVAENVIAISDALEEHFPGGCSNVRSLGVKTQTSIRIPLYLTLRTKASVRVPVIKAKRPKGFKLVSGELTTFANRVVTVLPSGEVLVKDKKRQRENDIEDELDFEFDDHQSESEDEEKPKIAKKEKQVKKKVKKDKDVEKEEEGENSNLEEAEENYLNFYQQEQVKLAKERKETKKNKQQNKKVEEDKESEDDLNLEDSDLSDFDHPNFDESDESESEEIIENFAEKKAGKNKPLNLHQQGKNNKKENKNTKPGKMEKGSANLKGKAGKPQVKKENTKVKQVTEKREEEEEIPILVEVPQGVSKKGNKVIFETKKETKASGQKNTKSTKKQNKTEVPEQDKSVAVIKQNKKGVLTKQNSNATSPKQNKKKFVVKEIVAESPVKKVKKEVENKTPKQQKVDSKLGKAKFNVNKKSGKKSSPFAKRAK